MDKNQTTEYTNDTTTQTSSDWKQATGEINIKLVNDYLFRALLQKNNRVLKGLIASLLHMEMEDIQSVIIKNEIILGKHIPDKAFILDIRVLMNDVRKQMEQKDKQLDQQSKQINVLSKQRDEDALLIAKLLKENEELRRNQK